MEVKLTVDEIGAKLFDSPASMTCDQQKLSLQLYRLLSQGNPVSAKSLADYAGITEGEAKEFLNDRFGAYKNEAGEVIGYMGLAIKPMAHRFNVDGKKLFTWCAWDSLFIPGLLEASAEVSSKDPITEAVVELSVSATGLRSNNEKAVMSVLIPTGPEGEFAEQISEDIIGSFCHHVHFFEAHESAERYVADKEGSYAILSLDESFKLGQMWNKHAHGEALAASSVEAR